MGDGGEKLITNAQYFDSFRLRSRQVAVPERSRRAVQVPDAQFQIPEKSYTIMSYAGGRG